MLTTPGVAERNEGTFRALCDKHPSEPHTEIAASLETALRAPADCHVASAVRIGKVDNPFDPEAVRATIMRANPHSSPGPCGLRFCHLQAVPSTDLAEDLSAFAQVVFSGKSLSQGFWSLHSSATLSAIGGNKLRPIACGDVLRRTIGGTFRRQYSG